MKKKLMLFSMFGTLALTVAATGFLTFLASSDAKLKVVSNHTFLLPGDFVAVKLNVTVPEMPAKSICGFVKWYIAFEGGDFQELVSSGGLQVDECEVAFAAKGRASTEIERKLLWNHVPETRHLNSEAAREFMKGKLETHYVFSEPGTYGLKAIITFIDQSKVLPIESNIVSLEIFKPEGEDAVVWQEIKDRPDIAYLLQMGELPVRRSKPEVEKLQTKIERLLSDHPNSRYGTNLRSSLASLKSREAKR